MGTAYNEKTGEIILFVERKYISIEEAKKLFPNLNEVQSDLRDVFYWKQNDDGTWSILPK